MKKLIFFSLLWFFLFLKISLGTTFNTLINVYHLKEPIERLVFEFDRKPQFEIYKEGQKLILKLLKTSPQDTNWIKGLSKEIYKEFNVLWEKDYLLIEFNTFKEFNFQTNLWENKLIIDLLWKEETKPALVIIKGDKVIKSAQDTLELPKYEYPQPPNLTNFQPPFTKKYTGIPISVDFQEADVHSVFRLLAEVGGINIVVSEKVKGNITLKLKQVPWDQVLDVVLSNFGLGTMKVGDIIRIAPLEEIKSESEKIRDYITTLKDIQEKSILITKTFQLRYFRGNAILDALKGIITGEGKITFDSNTNTLIVKDTPKNVADIEKIIRQLDIPPKQVLIEARIVEVQDNYAHKLGIRWGGSAYKGTEHTILGVGRSPQLSSDQISYNYPGGRVPGNSTVNIGFPVGPLVDLGTVGTSNLGFAFGHIGKSVILLDAELNALESQGVARIFARPKILTLDYQDAEIKQGYKIPYLQLTQYGVATTQFIEAVLRLKVTPQITPDNRINLEIEIEKSTPDWGRNVQGVPAVLTRYAKTKVLMNNGETLVIGGIKTNDLAENLDTVPGLSQVPGIGELFKKREKNLDRSELMVFITPKIISVEIPGVDY